MTERPWLRFYDDGVPPTLAYPDEPLHAFLAESARRVPDAPATIFFGATLTYRELDREVDAFAAALQRAGVAKGDRVALILPNSPQYVIAFYGSLRAGAVVVPCNPLYTAAELRHQLADAGATVVAVLSRAYPALREALPGTAVRDVIVTNIKDYMPPALRTLFTLFREKKEGHRVAVAPRHRRFRAFRSLGDRPSPVDVRPSDLAALLYTGGTTGVPKGAMLSHRALVANALQSRSWYPRTVAGRTKAIAVMPFFHAYGLTVVMNEAIHGGYGLILIPRFDLEMILKAIAKYRPALFAGAPRIYVAVNNSPRTKDYDLRSIEACVSGSAPLPIEVANEFERITHGGKVVEGYGLTEAAPVTHCNPILGRRKVGTIGIPFPDVDAKIVDLETGTRDLPVGEVGELVVRGPNLMDGYWQAPAETALVLRDGWLFTGDIARMDDEGYFTIVDRKKEMIIVSGFNVYPREVEEALYAHPAVLEAGAIGVADAKRGEVVKAFVALRPGMVATPEELIAHCAASLARYKVPVAIEIWPELPKTLIGKVLRRKLAEGVRT
ncbi:MAG TPA: long-chain fatty acid--CoA ligase [Candidatus Limnocylindria bacterium]|nr:long-chain fatty acid--CoA ligase [Candidatus Limnocylindria bacterium]